MTPAQTHAFRERLLTLQNDLDMAEARGADGQRVVELDQQAVGRLSRMDALQNQALAQANARQRSQQAARISAALARIAEGSYGECLECGEEIPTKRLEFDPTVPLCISCASG